MLSSIYFNTINNIFLYRLYLYYISYCIILFLYKLFIYFNNLKLKIKIKNEN